MNKKFTSTSLKLSGQTQQHYSMVTQFLLLALGSVLYHAKCVLQVLYAPFKGGMLRYSRVAKLHTVLLQAFQLKIGRILLPIDSRIKFQHLKHLSHRYNDDDNAEFNRQKFLSARLPFQVLMASFFAFIIWSPVVVNAQPGNCQEYLNEPGAASVLKFNAAGTLTVATNPNRGYYNYPEPTAARLSTISSLFVYANHNPL